MAFSAQNLEEPPHAKLRALLPHLQHAERSNVDPAPPLRRLVQLPTREEDCKRMLRLVTEYNEKIQSLFLDTSPILREEPEGQLPRRRYRETPKYQARDSAHTLYQVFASQWPGCQNPHEAKLRLTTYKSSRSLSLQEPTSFDMLFSTHSEPCRWQESRILVTDKVNPVLPKFPWKSPAEDICGLIRGSQEHTSRLHMLVDKDGLWQIPSLENELVGPGFHPTVSLRTLLEEGHLREGSLTFKLKDKRILAVVLAHSLLQLCEGPWLSKEWGNESIFFLHRPTDQTLLDIHRPYISTHFKTLQSRANKVSTGESDRHALYNHPSILALGILLLEIETGKTIRPVPGDCDPDTGRPNVNTAWTTASRMLKDPDICDRVYQDFRSVIEACLESDKFLTTGMTFDDLSFREKVYENIVAPLEDELFKGWPAVSLDSQSKLINIRTFTTTTLAQRSRMANSRLFNHQDNYTNPSVHPRDVSTTNESTDSLMDGPPKDVSNRSDPFRQTVNLNSQPFLFDDESVNNLEEISGWSNRWFNLLHRFHEAHIFPLWETPGKEPKGRKSRVRIAILDTGIDGTYPVFRSHWKQIKRIRSWVGQDVEDVYGNGATSLPLLRKVVQDDYGHGTHTAALLVKVAPGADVFVARIATDRKVSNVDNVADAIRWANKICKVDIITMSFGFKHLNCKIDDALQDAYRDKRILFAAASNQGGNGPIAYPANQRTVICINSCDGNGNSSGFNPTPEPNAVNFSTLGAGVELSWKGCKVHKSGTSYATPVAAGIAASLLDYARYHLDVSEEQNERLYSCDGMRNLFMLMAEKRGEHHYVAPWKFWDGKEQSLVHGLILDRLGPCKDDG
ncbi:MAG: hypothetical protein M1813_002206 [Trichoglossum hirsutum]|nr:MAG: hypothetical protein M1813_002206 [Trichoglossum hirsutum]